MTQAKLPAHQVAELKRLDVAHHLPGQTDYRLQAELGGSRIITHAEGCTIHDAEGHAILDGMAGLWCVNAGYGREELARAAYEQMQRAAVLQHLLQDGERAGGSCWRPRSRSCLGGNLSHVFFNTSGSEAIDTVLRLVRHYWTVQAASRSGASSSAAGTPTTARRSRARASAA